MGRVAWSNALRWQARPVAEALDRLDQQDRDERPRQHHLGHEALVAVADAKIAQAAAADRADHGRIADQADHGEVRPGRCRARASGIVDLAHDLHRGGAHGAGGLIRPESTSRMAVPITGGR